MRAASSRFDDKIALITGGTSGMGLATARRLLDEGARVVITGREKTRLDAAVQELAAGDRVLAVAGDAANLADLDALTAAIDDRFGRLDLVFANAGIGAFQQITDVTEAEFYRVVDINFKAAFFTIQKALPLLAEGGAIVINASFALHKGSPGAALYSATKAAVHNLARTLAAELAPKRIRVNSVSPGYTATPAFEAEASEDVRASAVAAVASGRIGTSEEVAAAVAFLASDEGAYINGQDLLIDGGLVNATPAAMI
ncbi:NAD(P)-dependent dehydrogenase (short-subunit alcohol dehydrogenase family) [Nocardia tenerifensis]|uniref:NAD(P)-dependent dehydrogenase (Short-subunit alcohol dehydrogenase family) n=1 Tax=Nocardia tenerifensis TaxID=228006 RepID=A0A318JRN7_9NOCA|nr:glucose 1-dehydrogenase [Nocardia tenerifensis]PXX54120.1 NAD(P)-dependent dehydrogenase (short-subunit alcohol dehydrogenase family) [Nocardia tenerifensis]